MKKLHYLFLIFILSTGNLFSHAGKETFVLREVAKIHSSIYSETPGNLDVQKLVQLLKETADHKKDTEKFKKALPIAEELGKATDLSKKRELFERLSKELESIVGHHDKSGVSVFYCPMLKKKWLASGKEIKNPYDSKMKNCGEIIHEAK
ncbi:LIC13259/LIC11441 family protein [Leptospira koniambonensis]|uniref:LIC13259/LIC11441 family protein n=1 Tax=Leptospira koniambonensis TaxID=2484950 RepID=UPI003EBD0522